MLQREAGLESRRDRDRDRVKVSGRALMPQRMEVDDFVSQSLLVRIHDSFGRQLRADGGEEGEEGG